MIAPKRLFALAFLSAVGFAAAPALAQEPPPPPSAPPSDMAAPEAPANPPGDAAPTTPAPSNAPAPGAGPNGNQTHPGFAAAHQDMATMFINAAIEQRRIGAEMAYRRMIGMALRGLAAMDRNDDGQVSQREFMAGMAVLFERLDANGDGVLSEADMRAHAEHGAFAGNDQRFGGADGQNFGMPGMGQNFGGGMGPGFGGGFGPHFDGPMQGPNGNGGGPNFGGPNAGPQGGGMGYGMPHQLFRH